MGTKNFSNANDLITFSRASGGTALRKVAYSPELISNGEFTSDTSGWAALGATQAIVSGELEITTTSAGGGSWQLISVTPNKPHLLTLDRRVGTADIASVIVYDGGIPGSGAPSLINDTDAGTFSEAFVPTNDTVSVYLRAAALSAGTTAYYDNISVKEVLFDQPGGTLQLFNHPTNIPRIEYDADGNLLGLLIEESRTNLATRSNEFDNGAGWVAGRVDITPNAAVSPDGNLNAYKLSQAAGETASGFIYDIVTVSNSATYTASVFAKKGTSRDILTINENIFDATSNFTYFDLSSGTVGTTDPAHTAVIEDVGNGWYRCSITFTSSQAAGYFQFRPLETDGSVTVTDNQGFIYLYGAQLEQGSFPTSYIPTSGATATRAADVASIPVSEFGYNQNQGTVVVEARTNNSGSTDDYVFQLDDDTNNNRYVIRLNNTSGTTTFVVDNGSATATDSGSVIGEGDTFKVAFAFSDSDQAVSLDGASVQTFASAIPSNLLTLNLGSTGTSAFLDGHIKSIRYFPLRLTNATLQELTR